MNKLNLTFYKNNNKYSDGDIELKIIDYLKNNKSPNYLNILKKDNSWPVYYHLSKVRHNIINWYHFEKNSSVLEVGAGMGAISEYLCQKVKSVTSIESSKTRATAILERTKNYNNIEIIVGNFNDIQLKKKFDYIVLIGVFEYAEMFKLGDNVDAYKEFLLRLKKYLNKDGKILIAIENRFGLKYWCGAEEDHTNSIYDGINNYKVNNNVKTFSKNEWMEMASEVGLQANFYYPLPDYKFPEYIITDEFLEKGGKISYSPYYCKDFKMFANERKLFKDVIKNNVVGFFANSFFIELSNDKCPKKISFVKNNISRIDKYCTQTYEQDNKFYKKALNMSGQEHIDNIMKYDEILKKHEIKTVEIHSENQLIYTNYFDAKSLDSILADLYVNQEYEKMYKMINEYIDYLKKHFAKENVEEINTIFENYKVNITKKKKEQLYFIKDGFIDLIFQNILIKNDEYYAIDQEWYEEYIPIEYILFRALNIFVNQTLYNQGIYNTNNMIFDEIISNLNINLKDNIELYNKLEQQFLKKVFDENIENKCYGNFTNYENYEDSIDESIKNYNIVKSKNRDLESKNKDLEDLLKMRNEEITNLNEAVRLRDETINGLNQQKEYWKNQFDLIINSKTWKIKTYVDNILRRNKN